MKLSELKPKMGGVNAEFEVVEKGDIREFSKFGKSGKVCNAVVKDDSGSVKLSLWNEDCDRINLGDKLKLTEGWVGEYQGELQLSTGRAGKLEVVGKGSGEASAKAESEPAPVPAPKAALKTNFASKKGLDGNDTEEEPDDDDDLGDDDDVDEEFVE